MDEFTVTERTRAKRLYNRARYERETVYAILDAGLVCHIGYEIDRQPFVAPTAYWREGNKVYWHGSAASRMLRHQASGAPLCLTVSHLDGFVLARSGFHHSVNYRSVMILVLNVEEFAMVCVVPCSMDIDRGSWRGRR